MISNTWSISDKDFINNIKLNETLFTVANGYLGVRGNYEEGVPENIPTTKGTYINAFFESSEIQYGEKLFGFPNKSQSIVNLIDAQGINIKIDGEYFSLFKGEVKSYNRSLDFRDAIAKREIHWKSPKGHEMLIGFKRLVSLTIKELFLIQVQIKSLNYSGTIEVTSNVDGDVSNMVSEDDPRIGAHSANSLEIEDLTNDKSFSYVTASTRNTKQMVVCGIAHDTKSDKESIEIHDKSIEHKFQYTIREGEEISIRKYVIYTDSRRHAAPYKNNIQLLNEVVKQSFDYHCNDQAKYLQKFWSNADVCISGDEKLQQGIRFNMFHLLQSVGKDELSNISAKGLTGEGYEGHYFWDTEIYIFPFFLFTNPQLAKNLLEYRYSILENARTRAIEMGHSKGVLFPWRTINGDECSPFFPAGTAQYHINTDVAYSIIQYLEATDDQDFLLEKGMEMLIEISRLMFEVGHFRRDGLFCIDAVTGPDEYTCIVNNNYYTNSLVKHLFNRTVSFYNELKEKAPTELDQLKSKLNLNDKEISDFEKADKNVFLPFDEEMQIHPQDDSFLNKKVWDFENTPKENYPLLLNYHPLTLYRYQVCKQADTLLSHFLLDNDDNKLQIIKNDFDYYEKITTHDSSLSTCIFSIMSNRVGQFTKAYDYFMNTARLDIDNLHHNSSDGIHTACMGGSWMSIVFGFAGMRLNNGILHFRPNLPEKWNSLEFHISFKNRKIKCLMSKDKITFNLLKGDSLQIKLNAEDFLIQ
jgi:Trehalose and maltose hydrolases (possible phosphorylases)